MNECQIFSLKSLLDHQNIFPWYFSMFNSKRIFKCVQKNENKEITRFKFSEKKKLKNITNFFKFIFFSLKFEIKRIPARKKIW